MATKKFSPEQVKHLEFLQDLITRMNSNSFQMKGWMVVVLAALLGIHANTGNDKFVLTALIPTFIFWCLDAYYLQQERKFRGVYDDAAGVTKNHKVELFAMPVHLYKEGKYSFWNVLGSRTLILTYLPVLFLLVVIYFIL